MLLTGKMSMPMMAATHYKVNTGQIVEGEPRREKMTEIARAESARQIANVRLSHTLAV
jgi:hypothetical protein